MEQKIDYNDNIFLLSLKLKLIEDSLKLNIDISFFLANIKNEITFISKGIEKYFKTLNKNTILLNRADCLKNLKRLVRNFINLILHLTDHKNQYLEYFDDVHEKYNEFINIFNDIEDQMVSIVTNYSIKTQDEKLIISENEYKVLFSNEEEH